MLSSLPLLKQLLKQGKDVSRTYILPLLAGLQFGKKASALQCQGDSPHEVIKVSADKTEF